jgi:hypothetical protein
MGRAVKRHGRNEYRMIECLPFQQDQPGFALPIFAHLDDSRLRVVQEIDELLGTIVGYRLLDDDLSSSGVKAFYGPLARIGGPVVHAFISNNGAINAGTLAELTPVLRAFVLNNPHHPAVTLQIHELTGTEQEKKIARLNMRDLINVKSGARSARSFYEGSVLRTALWDQLLSAAPNNDFARLILASRPRLSAEVDSQGKIKLDLSFLQPADRAKIDEKKIIDKLMKEFETSPDHVGTLLEHISVREDDIQRVSAEEIVARMRSTGRQEERIAILADAILQSRESGIAALIAYNRDRGAVANWALDEFRSKLINGSSVRQSDEHIVADMIPRLFTNEYPLNRGDLLFFLAKHLAKWPAVNIAIRSVLSRTKSFVVNQQRKQIERFLTNPEGSNKQD